MTNQIGDVDALPPEVEAEEVGGGSSQLEKLGCLGSGVWNNFTTRKCTYIQYIYIYLCIYRIFIYIYIIYAAPPSCILVFQALHPVRDLWKAKHADVKMPSILYSVSPLLHVAQWPKKHLTLYAIW